MKNLLNQESLSGTNRSNAIKFSDSQFTKKGSSRKDAKKYFFTIHNSQFTKPLTSAEAYIPTDPKSPAHYPTLTTASASSPDVSSYTL